MYKMQIEILIGTDREEKMLFFVIFGIIKEAANMNQDLEGHVNLLTRKLPYVTLMVGAGKRNACTHTINLF